MTDTERIKAAEAPNAAPDEQQPESAGETAEQTGPTETFEDATQAADGDQAIDAFFETPFTIPGPPEASADGKWLAYLQPDADGTRKLWIAPTDGGEPRALDLPFEPVEDRDPDSGRLLRGPQWSPDGTRIAVTGMHPDGDRTAVWIVPVNEEASAQADAVAEEPILEDVPAATEQEADTVAPTTAPEADATPEEGNDYLVGNDDEEHHDELPGSPAIPEPDQYIVGHDDEDHHQDEETVEAGDASQAPQAAATESGPRLLVNHDGADRSPRWSPDGEIIAMTSTIDGRDVITLTTADGGDSSAIELLTWSRSNDREPIWSRDGKFLAFTRQRPEEADFADIYCFSLESGELKNLTSEKSPAIRHSLEWVPGRNLIAYVTRENDWLSISVVNADNKAGWTVTRESGDKTEPRFAQDEARMVYVRTEGFTTVVCERSLHASSAVALDPGEGVARYPRWLAGKQVAYGFSAPQRPFGFLVQENTAKSDRTALPAVGQPALSGVSLRQPQPFEFEVGPEEIFSGMLYRTPDIAGLVPGVIYMPDGPLTTRRGEFQLEEQALASSAMTVLTPVIHGATGFGAAVENDLRDFAHTELESSDIAEAGRALGREESVDATRLALVGHGFGGTLALVTAGARPGIYSMIVAIDPITEWSGELANAEIPWRNWVTDRLGMPLTHADHYALRTPATFSAVIDVPLLLVRTARASASRRLQMDMLTADLDEVGVAYDVLDAPDEPLAATLRRISREVSRKLAAG